MSTITSQTTTSASTRSTTTASKTENGTPIVMPGQEATKDLFLKMLVAQMQNQDPFNPQDPTQYITQLAQFTTMEQIMTMNSNLEYLGSLTNGLLVNSAMSGATTLIGKNVEVVRPEETETDSTQESEQVDSEQTETESSDILKGTVESVEISGGVVYMNVKDENGKVYSVEYAALIKVNQ